MKSVFASISVILLLFGIGACAGVDQKEPPGDMRKRISEAYGLQAFDQIAKIRFKFNVVSGEKQIERNWIWETKTDTVGYQGISSQLNMTVYGRKKIDADASGRLKQIDQWFINDSYWLLFPFHMAWDSQAGVEAAEWQYLPMGWGRALRVVVTYPPKGGYTPGDVYELFVDRDDRLVQWVYRRGGADPPTRVSTWEEHRQVGPITVAMSHKGKDGNFRLWFSDVAVQLEGSEEWIPAE